MHYIKLKEQNPKVSRELAKQRHYLSLFLKHCLDQLTLLEHK